MSWGNKAVLLVVGLGVGHVSFPQSFSEPEFEFDQSLFSYAGDKEVARPQFAEPSIIFTSWVILSADAEQMFGHQPCSPDRAEPVPLPLREETYDDQASVIS